MAIITQDGLFYGDRVKRLSLTAQLMYPRYMVAANTVGRLELNYQKILATVYASFKPEDKFTEEQFWSHIGEYFKADLLFTYEADGQLWGQWDTPANLLPRHPLKADVNRAIPPQDALERWKEEIRKRKEDNRPKAIDMTFFVIPANNSAKVRKVSKDSAELARGVGVGGGVGETRQGEAKPSRASASDPRHNPVKLFVKRCCEHRNVPFTWEGGEASALSSFLKGNPDMPEEQVIELVRRRFNSKDPPGDRPRIWIGNLGRYATENGNHGISKQDARVSKTRANITSAFSEIARRDGGLSQAGSERDDGADLVRGPEKLLGAGDKTGMG